VSVPHVDGGARAIAVARKMPRDCHGLCEGSIEARLRLVRWVSRAKPLLTSGREQRLARPA
jgi:hypothetical protein